MRALTIIFAIVSLGFVARADAAVVVALASEATLLPGGQAVEIAVTVTCPKHSDVLEAFVYIVQDGNQSPFAGIPIGKCKDKPVRYVVRVPAPPPGSSFHAGSAMATSYVLVQNAATGATESGGDNRSIVIQ